METVIAVSSGNVFLTYLASKIRTRGIGGKGDRGTGQMGVLGNSPGGERSEYIEHSRITVLELFLLSNYEVDNITSFPSLLDSLS